MLVDCTEVESAPSVPAGAAKVSVMAAKLEVSVGGAPGPATVVRGSLAMAVTRTVVPALAAKTLLSSLVGPGT